ncbi:MAG: peptidylprolyl isomerase [Caulobacterales bacterium]
MHIVRLALAAALAASLTAPAIAAKPKPAPAAAAPAGPADADWRTPDPQDVLVIDTSKGRIIVEMNAAAAPNHVARIRALVRAGVYDSRAFFRVIDNFMDQTGDPLDSGMGGSSMPNLAAEFTFKRGADTPFVTVAKNGGLEGGIVGSLPVISQTMDLGLLTADHKVQAWGVYCAGVAGMARAEDPDSANSQFYIMRTNANAADHATHALDKKYTAWGRVLAGQDVVDAIKTGEPVSDPDKMLSVKVLADLPEASRPKVRVIDPASAWFKAEIERRRLKAGIDFTVCSVPLSAEVK